MDCGRKQRDPADSDPGRCAVHHPPRHCDCAPTTYGRYCAADGNEILSRQALKRMISPEEVARLVLFLAADDSDAITNQSYVIDGGWV